MRKCNFDAIVSVAIQHHRIRLPAKFEYRDKLIERVKEMPYEDLVALDELVALLRMSIEGAGR
jgi:hypothetical protein